jgi:hypothetical protein
MMRLVSTPIPQNRGLQKESHMQVTKLARTAMPFLASLVLGFGSIAAAPAAGQSPDSHAASSKLVQIVRESTREFIDVNNAGPAGYGPFLGCVSGPDHGAMGVHYVNPTLVGDGLVNATQPEALIYEPSNGKMRLVGVEFIVDAATWLKSHDGAPVLEGQTFLLVTSPNRYNLPAFFELHVWAWRDNPQGAFVDWNNRVTCEKQQ